MESGWTVCPTVYSALGQQPGASQPGQCIISPWGKWGIAGGNRFRVQVEQGGLQFERVAQMIGHDH